MLVPPLLLLNVSDDLRNQERSSTVDLSNLFRISPQSMIIEVCIQLHGMQWYALHSAHMSRRELKPNAECPAPPRSCIDGSAEGWSRATACNATSILNPVVVKWAADGGPAVVNREDWSATQQHPAH